MWGVGIDQLLEWYNARTGQAYVPIVNNRNSVVATWDVNNRRVDQLASYNSHGRLRLYDAAEKLHCREDHAPAGTDSPPRRLCANPSGLPFGFVSALRSPITGLIYMRNRWYSPRMAQFVSQDPLGYAYSFNPYAYVGFDPINGWDPWGLGSNGFTNPFDRWLFTTNLNDSVDFSRYVIKTVNKAAPKAGQKVMDITGNVLNQFGITRGPLFDLLNLDRAELATGVQISASMLGNGLALGAHLINGATNTTSGGNDLANAATPQAKWEALKKLGSGALEFVGSALAMVDPGINAASEPPVMDDTPNLDTTDTTNAGASNSDAAPKGGGCFVAGTLVKTRHGLKPIETIRKGDEVWSRDPKTGKFGWKKVFDTIVHHNRRVLHLTLATPSGHTETLSATGNHPFWVKGEGFTRADKLRPGDEVFTSRGGWLRVTGATWAAGGHTVYNLVVADWHTYFVGDVGAWVHNGCGGDGDTFSSKGAASVSQKVANQANHIFGAKNLAKHSLGGVLDSFGGDSIAAFRAIETGAQNLANSGAIKGIFETTVKVGEYAVTVRGRVIDGVVNVSTAFIP